MSNSWTKDRSGNWKIKALATSWEAAKERGDNMIMVTKKNGQQQWVECSRPSRTFHTEHGDMLFLTPGEVTNIGHTTRKPRTHHTTRKTNTHRCESCGRSGAHQTTDISGITGWACNRCDDGSLSLA